jgi:hypothetical protein
VGEVWCGWRGWWVWPHPIRPGTGGTGEQLGTTHTAGAWVVLPAPHIPEPGTALFCSVFSAPSPKTHARKERKKENTSKTGQFGAVWRACISTYIAPRLILRNSKIMHQVHTYIHSMYIHNCWQPDPNPRRAGSELELVRFGAVACGLEEILFLSRPTGGVALWPNCSTGKAPQRSCWCWGVPPSMHRSTRGSSGSRASVIANWHPDVPATPLPSRPPNTLAKEEKAKQFACFCIPRVPCLPVRP